MPNYTIRLTGITRASLTAARRNGDLTFNAAWAADQTLIGTGTSDPGVLKPPVSAASLLAMRTNAGLA
jgi:hypothetical protein